MKLALNLEFRRLPELRLPPVHPRAASTARARHGVRVWFTFIALKKRKNALIN